MRVPFISRLFHPPLVDEVPITHDTRPLNVAIQEDAEFAGRHEVPEPGGLPAPEPMTGYPPPPAALRAAFGQAPAIAERNADVAMAAWRRPQGVWDERAIVASIALSERLCLELAKRHLPMPVGIAGVGALESLLVRLEADRAESREEHARQVSLLAGDRDRWKYEALRLRDQANAAD